ncbi:hypothetical protein ACYSTU_20085 [Pseudomonas glycinis]
MNSKFIEMIESLDGVSDFSLLEAPKSVEDVTTARGRFSYNELKMGFQQIHSQSITMNILQASFRYNTTKKPQKTKILEALNSFNRTTPGIKGSLKEATDKSFSVVFTMEFICPDELINEQIISPSIKIIFSSGKMLKDTLGRHGISLAPKQ